MGVYILNHYLKICYKVCKRGKHNINYSPRVINNIISKFDEKQGGRSMLHYIENVIVGGLCEYILAQNRSKCNIKIDVSENGSITYNNLKG
jgi:ATP-dependent Clp protease ATP-binding subunit ClpA